MLVDDGAVLVLPLGAGRGGRALAAVHGRHVLPHQQPQAVRPVEPPLRLDLDVLADHVEAQVLVLLQVVPEGRVGGSGVEAVRPVALVQGAALEDERPVEHGALDTVHVLHRDRPHPRVRADPVGARTAGELGRDVVQERVLRRPQAGVGHRYGELLADRAGGGADLCTAVGDGDLGARAVGPGRTYRHPQRVVLEVRDHVEPGDARGGSRLQPDRLPDPGRGGVEDAVPGVRGHVLDALLADGLAAGLRGVVRGHDDGVGGAAVQQRRDVVRERVVAPSVDGPGLLPVDPDRGLPVGGAEVELDPSAAPAGRDGEGALVPELVVLGDLPLDARERGLRREGHPDLLAERRRLTGVARRDGEVPDAVEIGPVGAGELRSRILRQRVVDRDLVGPRRRHRCGLGGPGRRGGAGGGRAGGEEAGDGECQHRGGGRDAPPDRYGSQHGDRSSVSVAHGGTPPAGRWNWFNTGELAARTPQHSPGQLSRPKADNVVGRSLNSRFMAPR